MIATVDYRALQDSRLFKKFPDDVLKDLAQHCRYVELPAGQSLFQQDETSNSFYLLTEGQIHVVRQYPTGEEVILATEGPYYVIGELSMLADQPRTGGVIAVSDSTLIALSRSDFMATLERHPAVAAKVVVYLSRRLYRMNLFVREHAIGNVSARIASLLLLLSGGAQGTISTDVRVNRVARAVAVEGDVVARILQKWVEREYITFDGRTINVLDIEALNNIAG